MNPSSPRETANVSGTSKPDAVDARDVVLVNGYKVFYRALPEELDRAGRLLRLVTGAYPFVRLENMIAVLKPFTRLAARLKSRRFEVCEKRIEACWLGECINYLAIGCDHKGWHRCYKFLNGFSIDIMSRRSGRILGRSPDRQKIFYVRSGYGGHAVKVAKRLGYFTICEHTIAHPRIIEGLIRENGNLESKSIAADPQADIWRRAANDISLCDHVLVCSDFVKSTFVKAGARTDNLDVIYWGIDGRFLTFVSAAKAKGQVRRKDGPLKLLFAGGLTRRKGIATLADAMAKIRDLDCRLKIAGALSVEHRPLIAGLTSDSRVTMTGVVPRDGLAELMCRAEIFIFPSLAEGSAQVIFEAMAAGCFIITTPNSGSIVRDGIHGFVVPPGDAGALADAVRRAAADRSRIAEIGARNAQIVASEYSQDKYGKRVVELLDSLTASQRSKSGFRNNQAESEDRNLSSPTHSAT